MKQHIPNFVTGLRIALTPLIAFVLWQPQEKWLTALGLFLFIIASASDWLDGYLARQMSIISPVGRMLDPIADKLLVTACLLSLAAGRVGAVILMSARSATLFRDMLARHVLDDRIANMTLIAGSAAIATAAGPGWREEFVARRSTRARLLAIAALFYHRRMTGR